MEVHYKLKYTFYNVTQDETKMKSKRTLVTLPPCFTLWLVTINVRSCE